MSVPPVQTFGYEDRVYDGLSHGVLVVEEARLVAEEEDPIRVRIDDDGEEGDDYFVGKILPLGEAADGRTRVAVFFSDFRWSDVKLVVGDPF